MPNYKKIKIWELPSFRFSIYVFICAGMLSLIWANFYQSEINALKSDKEHVISGAEQPNNANVLNSTPDKLGFEKEEPTKKTIFETKNTSVQSNSQMTVTQANLIETNTNSTKVIKLVKSSDVWKYYYDTRPNEMTKYLFANDLADSWNKSVYDLAQKLRNFTSINQTLSNYYYYVRYKIYYPKFYWQGHLIQDGIDINTNLEQSELNDVLYKTYPASLTLQKGYGLCDEKAVLFVALARANGMPARIVAGATDYPNLFHWWVEVWNGNCWQEIDPTFWYHFNEIKSNYHKLKIIEL